MDIKKIVIDSLQKYSNGKIADTNAKVMLSAVIKENRPFNVVELDNKEQLLLMMKDADFPHLYGEGGVFYFSAFYYHDDRHPLGRNYFIREKDLLGIARIHDFFKYSGLDLPIVAPDQLAKKARLNGFEKRIAEFKERQDKEMRHFRELFEGRSKSTTVSQSMFLNSPGCLVCGCDEYLLMSSTLSANTGFMIGFNLCKKHEEIAQQENSLIEYLIKLLGGSPNIQALPMSTSLHRDMTLALLPKALESRVEKLTEDTITLRRNSGIKGIFRISSPTNYAYTIIGPNDEHLARIDSADHHDVNFGPDHIHPDLKRKKPAIEPSFTTGNPLIDIKKILAVIQQKEIELSLV